jgi:hypothetical protein
VSINASANAADAGDRFAAAHAALKADPSIQFNLPPTKPPPESPEWLKAFFKWLGDVLEPVGRFLRWLTSLMPDAPYARILLWLVIGIVAAAAAWMIYQRIRSGEWQLPQLRPRMAKEAPIDEEWAPDADPVRSWLEEADALAAQGRFAEAVHHLLYRSIEDIGRRRPNVVRPALTSREIAATEAIPNRARDLFAGIARLVERSLFGGRDVGADDWTTARSAYADFALPQAWRA